MQSQQRYRAAVAYKPTNQIFLQKEKNYIQQYSHVYMKRLLALRPPLQRYLRDTKNVAVVEKVIGLKVNERISVVGTVYKDQKLKPNVLDEFSMEVGSAPKAVLENYAADDDSLLLEDDSGRCNLIGTNVEVWAQTVATMVSGVVVGCIGKLMENGTFEVEELVFPGDVITRDVRPFVFQDSANPSDGQHKRYLMLTSGVFAGSTSDRSSLFLQMLIDYVQGVFDSDSAASVVRIVVAGGAISPPRVEEALQDTTIDAKMQVETQQILVDSLQVADRAIAELVSACPVDIMPGEFDPSNTSLPQQPLHPCLFPLSSRYAGSLRLTSNPESFVLGDNLVALGHSGQPVKDMLRYIVPGSASELDLLEASLIKFRHLAPTAPDTLACYPFHDRDPFVLEKDNCKLLFSGGSSKFQTKFVAGTRLVCIPEFKGTKQVVLVDLDSAELEARAMQFDVEV